MARELLDALRGRGRPVRLDRGERLLKEGESGDKIALIVSGRAKVSCVGAEGREVVLDFRGPGELVGELSAIDEGPRSSSVTAIEPLEAVVVAATDFRALVAAEPGMGLDLLRMLSRRFRDADRKRIEFGASDTVGRTAARLVELAERYGEPAEGGIGITLPISQEELAGWTGSSRAGMADALRTLRELGWIETDRRRITVRDIEALRGRSA